MAENTEDFDTALDRFIVEAQSLVDDYYQKYSNLPRPILKIDSGGRRYIRILKDSSVFCFIDRNGDVLKAATFKAPAKHARGNIFKGHACHSVGPYGAKYLKG